MTLHFGFHLDEADAIQFAKKCDFDGFIEGELKTREQFRYPPFRHLVHHVFRGENSEKVLWVAEQWAKRAELALGGRAELRGPSPSPIERVKNEYRFQIWYFTTQVTQVVGELVKLQREFPWPKGVSQTFDVDPMSLS